MSEITAVVTVHDPHDNLYSLTIAWLPRLIPLYRSVVALHSAATSSRTLALLRKHGVQVQGDSEMPAGMENMGVIRRLAIKAGLEASATAIHLCDFDRLLHWVMTYPDELCAVLGELPAGDLIVLGRSERAFLTHPACQVDTERLSNHVFELVASRAWDVAGGSRGLSRVAAEFLLETSSERHVGVDAEWPILVLANPDLRVAYRACEGLEFETPDRFPEDVAKAGGVRAWVAQMDRSPAEWARRLDFARWTAEAAVCAAERVARQRETGAERSG